MQRFQYMQNTLVVAKKKMVLLLPVLSTLRTDRVRKRARQDAHVIGIMPSCMTELGPHLPALVIKVQVVLMLAPARLANGDMPATSTACRLLEDSSKLLKCVLKLATPGGRMTSRKEGRSPLSCSAYSSCSAPSQKWGGDGQRGRQGSQQWVLKQLLGKLLLENWQ